MLAGFGCIVAGVASTVGQALADVASTQQIDAAILDVHIGGELIFPVADALADREVPFVFSTGFGPSDLAQRYPESRVLAKPYASEALAEVLASLRDTCAGPTHRN